MSLRSALLAILRVGPMSGYGLAKQFSHSVGHVWYAADSQIYPELRKMAEEHLVTMEEQPRGERGLRRLYHITPAGEEAFHAWMNSPLEYQRTREAAHLRAAYLETATPEAARSFFRDHAEHWRHELQCWEDEIGRIDAVTNPMLVRRLEQTPETDRERTIAYKRFTYEGLAAKARVEIEWAERGQELVASLERSTDER